MTILLIAIFGIVVGIIVGVVFMNFAIAQAIGRGLNW